MKIEVIGKNISVTEALDAYCKKAFKKLEKYNVINSIRAVIRTYNVGTKIEATAFTNDTQYHAEVQNEDLYAAIDLVSDKLSGQFRKNKTKNENTKKSIPTKYIEDQMFDDSCLEFEESTIDEE